MKITLYFPDEIIDAMKRINLHLISPETLKWSADNPPRRYQIGTLIGCTSGKEVDGLSFSVFANTFGAWIETDSEDTSRLVRNALVTSLTGACNSIKVVQEQ